VRFCARTRPGGATHALRDGDEADAVEQQGAAGVAAGPGEGRQSDPSRGSEARHAHAWPHARAPAQNRTLSACCARGRCSASAHTRTRGHTHAQQHPGPITRIARAMLVCSIADPNTRAHNARTTHVSDTSTEKWSHDPSYIY
jgi:hypothetical protein